MALSIPNMPFVTTSLLTISVALGSHLAQADLRAKSVPHQTAFEEWTSEVGDRFLVDTQQNEGYLIHEDGEYVRFPVVTGQNRYVYYIGRGYKATTPAWNWVSTEMTIKGDHLTFGPSGRFLRLFKNGNERTAYGIHEYGREEDLFSPESSERFRSMGCVIVQQSMMDLLVETFEKNGNRLEVKTQFGGLQDQNQIVSWFSPNAGENL